MTFESFKQLTEQEQRLYFNKVKYWRGCDSDEATVTRYFTVQKISGKHWVDMTEPRTNYRDAEKDFNGLADHSDLRVAFVTTEVCNDDTATAK